jgi:hypothetical protein
VKRGRCAYKQLESMLAFDFPELVIEERQVRNAMAILKPCRSASTGQCKRLWKCMVMYGKLWGKSRTVTSLICVDYRGATCK